MFDARRRQPVRFDGAGDADPGLGAFAARASLDVERQQTNPCLLRSLECLVSTGRHCQCPPDRRAQGGFIERGCRFLRQYDAGRKRYREDNSFQLSKIGAHAREPGAMRVPGKA